MRIVQHLFLDAAVYKCEPAKNKKWASLKLLRLSDLRNDYKCHHNHHHLQFLTPTIGGGGYK